MYGGLRRGLGLGSRLAQQQASLALRAPGPKQAFCIGARPLTRPFGALGGNAFQQLAAVQKAASVQAAPALESRAVPLPSSAPAVGRLAAEQAQAVEGAESTVVPGGKLMDTARSSSMVFEIGLTFTFLHYQSIFIGVMRCLFQAFRPLLILFVFGQILKAVFFIAGAPIWFSFYSIWLFEVGYGLAQCAISFIFISFFYNNLSFARVRPTLAHMLRQQREKLSRAAQLLSGSVH